MKVVPFPGVTLVNQGAERQPDLSLIELLETYLALARAGELTGIAIAAVARDHVREVWRVGPLCNQHALLSAVSILQHRVCAHIDGLGINVVEGGEPPTPA